VDVVEIGDAQLKMGGVYRVKPLGVYAMIDDGELDWKVSGVEGGGLPGGGGVLEVKVAAAEGLGEDAGWRALNQTVA